MVEFSVPALLTSSQQASKLDPCRYPEIGILKAQRLEVESPF